MARTVTLFWLASFFVWPINAAGCRTHLSDTVGDVNIRAGSAIEALLRFGFESGVCLGVEAPDSDLLKQPVQLQAARPAVAYVIQSLLGSSRFQISEHEGVILLKNVDAMERTSQLDAALPDYEMPKISVALANLNLFMRLTFLADPSLGFAGHVSDRNPDDQVGPFKEHGRTARELLTLFVGRSAGGAWISGRCVGPALAADGPCWTILRYLDHPEIASGVIERIVEKLLAEQSARKKEPPPK